MSFARRFFISAPFGRSRKGVSQLGPPLGAPDWALRWFLVAAGIGFPFWSAFAWFYEFTRDTVIVR